MRKIVSYKIWKRYYSGSIALTTVIVFSAILLAAGITIVFISIDLRRATVGYNQLFQAKIHARSCLEESVNRLKYDNNFNGDISVDAGDLTCMATVIDDAGDPDIRVISIISTLGEYEHTSTERLNVGVHPFELE